MKDKILNIVKFLIFTIVGLFLFWLVYRKQDVDEMLSALDKADYFWIWLSLGLGLLSHLSRAIRWRLLIQHLGYKVSVKNAFLAVMVNYIANLAVPRLGEVSRCGVLKTYEQVPFSKSFGTVIAERAVDMIMLLLLLVIVMLSQGAEVMEFMRTNPEMQEKIHRLASSKMLIYGGPAALVFLLFLFIAFRKKISHFSLYQKIKDFIINLLEGAKSVLKMKQKWQFIAHTVFIWGMYYLMTYLCFYSFSFTSHLSPMTGLTVFVMASFGMVAPVQGGIGAWHFMVTRTLLVFGITIEPDGNAFALVVHGAQTLMLLVVGLLAIIALPLVNRKKKIITT